MTDGPRSSSYRYGVPINFETGQPITDAQFARLDRIKEGFTALRDLLHELDGTSAGDERFGSRLMALAGTHIETAELYAKKAALSVE
jgi:hypothetical protein